MFQSVQPTPCCGSNPSVCRWSGSLCRRKYDTLDSSYGFLHSFFLFNIELLYLQNCFFYTIIGHDNLDTVVTETTAWAFSDTHGKNILAIRYPVSYTHLRAH